MSAAEITKALPPPKLSLREARCLFTQFVARLIMRAQELGLQIALAEGMDRRTKKDPTSDHMKNSLHDLGLAQDLDLYRAGVYLNNTADHRILGEWWEKQHSLARWGGRFGDGNHYSFEWEGRK